jgi:hypothetical protein
MRFSEVVLSYVRDRFDSRLPGTRRLGRVAHGRTFSSSRPQFAPFQPFNIGIFSITKICCASYQKYITDVAEFRFLHSSTTSREGKGKGQDRPEPPVSSIPVSGMVYLCTKTFTMVPT